MKHFCFTMIFFLCIALIHVDIPRTDFLYAKTSISNHRFTRLFDEICVIVENNFYNPVQISHKFGNIKKHYRQKLSFVSDRRQFSSLINSMLGELRASHTYYLTPDDYEYYHLGDLFSKISDISKVFNGNKVVYPTVGIITRTIEKKTFIASVLPGGVAARAGLHNGDEIISANGKFYEPVKSLRPYMGKKVTFCIKRFKDRKPQLVVVKPVLKNPRKEMLSAQKTSVKIIKCHGKKIGYIHIYSYSGEEYHKQLRNALTWGKLKTADALIIDIRYGLGGAWPAYLNIFNRNIPVMNMKSRNGSKMVIDTQWRKPAVYLVNQYSRSGKELLVFGAKKYRLAAVIGERTPGHTLGGRLFPLSNRDFIFLAVQSCTIDGVNLEGRGVEPDITVPFDIRYCNGADPQLDRAVQYLYTQLSSKNLSERRVVR